MPYTHQLDLICSVPGFSANPMTVIAVISEIGADMSVFPMAKNLSSWVGCCPRNDQSGGKRKSTRISRAGAFLKPLLVQVSNAIVKYFQSLPQLLCTRIVSLIFPRLLFVALYTVLSCDTWGLLQYDTCNPNTCVLNYSCPFWMTSFV